MPKRESTAWPFPPDEADLLRHFVRYRRLVDDWTRKFGLEQSGRPDSGREIDYVLEAAFRYEIHST